VKYHKYTSRRNRGFYSLIIIGLWCLVFGLSMFFFQGRAGAASVSLAWDASDGAVGYKIYSGTTSKNYTWVVDVGNATSYTTANLTDGYTYYFAATAYDASGSESAYSDEVTYGGTSIPTAPFTDVSPSYWAYASIMAIYNAGITKGYGAGIFAPELTVTREQIAAFIVRAKEGEPQANYCSTGIPFPDCSPYSWSCGYIKRLSELGLTTGYGTTGLYMPSINVTRSQMAVFIVRAVEGEPSPYYCSSGSPFTDVISTDWSCKYIKRLAELGLTTGYGDGRYGPNDLITRAQMAVFLGRAFLGMQ
jgi:hypothetical protein